MKKIMLEVTPMQFVHDILPWFLQCSKVFVDYINIGQRIGLPRFAAKFVLESLEQHKEILDGPIWETKMMIPPIANIGNPIKDDHEFNISEYQIFIHYFDCNYLIVCFKDDTLAADFCRWTESAD